MSYVDTHAARLRDIKNLSQKIKDKGNMLDNSMAHNAKPRGRNLGTFSATHATAIYGGTFKDIYPGDYWVLNDNYKLLVVELNYFYGYSAEWGKSIGHHAVCIVINDKGSVKMNDDGSITGGFAGSYVYTDVFPSILSDLDSLLGSDHLFTIPYMYISDAADANTGLVTHWLKAENQRIFLPTVEQLLGVNLGYSHYRDMHRQFALFSYVKPYLAIASILNNFHTWLPETSAYAVYTTQHSNWGYLSWGGTDFIQGWYAAGSVATHPVLPYVLVH